MSFNDLPAREFDANAIDAKGNWQRADARLSRRVSIHGGHGTGERSWTPDTFQSDDDGRTSAAKRYGNAIRMTWEVKTAAEVDVVDVRSSRLTPPGIEQSQVAHYV